MAGKGTRMAKYYEGPKQLLPVLGKPILEHVLDNLPEEVTDLVFVVGGPHEQTIRDHFAAGQYGGRSITFVVQEKQLGLAHAFQTAKDMVKGKWLGLIADDLISSNALRELAQQELGVLAHKTDTPQNFGVLVTDEEGYLHHSVEKPKEFVSDLVWTGHMLMDQEFMEMDIEPSARGEYETPDVWMKLIERGRKIKVVESDFWLPINDKQQLEEAERIMRAKISKN